MPESATFTITDDATGIVHKFLADTDVYGVRVTHIETGNAVVLEVFNGVFQSLIFNKDAEEPLHVFRFPNLGEILPEIEDVNEQDQDLGRMGG